MTKGFGPMLEVARIQTFQAGPLQIRGAVKNAIIAGAKDRGKTLHLAPEEADLVFSVRETSGGLLISIDLAGQSLHLRGWRLEEGVAPLKETLSAQMLMLSRWDPRGEVLLDPMAGSGTIAAVASHIAKRKVMVLNSIAPYRFGRDATVSAFRGCRVRAA